MSRLTGLSEVSELLSDSAAQLLERHCGPQVVAAAEASGWSPELWRRLEAAELTRVGIPEERGGSGGGLEEAAAVLWQAGRFAAPVPLAETSLLAGRLLAGSELELPEGPLSAGALAEGSAQVPYGRCAGAVVLLEGDGVLLLLRAGDFELEPGVNLAGEPRDRVRPRAGAGTRADSAWSRAEFRRLAALARAIQIAGALEAVLEQTVDYAAQRHQFGSPLNRFQAVQELMVGVAQEAAAAAGAVRAAIQEPSPYLVAAAKARASRAAGAAARGAHQVHGAIGFTHEHALHLHTRRLWSWRDEYGSEAEWSRVLGEMVRDAGPGGLWPLITREGSE